jgi:hypothetical protein
MKYFEINCYLVACWFWFGVKTNIWTQTKETKNDNINLIELFWNI